MATASAAYPAHLARERALADGRKVLIRPVKPDDEPAERQFYESLSDETRRLRFQRWGGSLGPELIHFFTHVDYDRHMAFVCEAGKNLVGEARYVANPGGRSCEFGIVVGDAWHHSGIAQLLMDALIRAAQARGFETMEGLVLRDNRDMLRFVQRFGFEAQPLDGEPTTFRIVRKL
jgi:acetyltransferase